MLILLHNYCMVNAIFYFNWGSRFVSRVCRKTGTGEAIYIRRASGNVVTQDALERLEIGRLAIDGI